jgi:hypothetical protein
LQQQQPWLLMIFMPGMADESVTNDHIGLPQTGCSNGEKQIVGNL